MLVPMCEANSELWTSQAYIRAAGCGLWVAGTHIGLRNCMVPIKHQALGLVFKIN